LFICTTSIVQAVPVLSANVTATVEGVLTENTDSGGPVAAASVVGAEHSGRADVDSAGNIGTTAGFFGANGVTADIVSTAIWEDTFIYNVGDTATFDFFIPGGVIAFEANSVSGLNGSIGVAVVLNGVPIFSSLSEVQTLAGTPTTAADLLLTQTGTALSASFANGLADSLGLTGAGYTFGSFTGSFDLSTDALVGANALTYVMHSTVGDFIGETSAIASIGDPLRVNTGQPGVTLTAGPGGPVVTTPAPGSSLLLLRTPVKINLPFARRCIHASDVARQSNTAQYSPSSRLAIEAQRQPHLGNFISTGVLSPQATRRAMKSIDNACCHRGTTS
jgi:hypothetical protein